MTDPRAAELIDTYLDGELDAAGHEELIGLVNSDRAVAIAFARASFDDRRLRDELIGRNTGEMVAAPEPAREATPRTASTSPTAWVIASAAAAVITIAGALVVYAVVIASRPVPVPSPPDNAPVATLIDASGNVMVGNDLAIAGRDYPAREVHLESGTAEFQLTSGANVQIADHARLVLHHNMHASLTAGFARFNCPPSAHGYTVDLPGGARLVDLGTRFDIRIDPTGLIRVYVAEGSVVVKTSGGDAIGFVAGQVAAINDGEAFVEPPQLRAVRTDRYAHWSFDETDGDVLSDTGSGFDAAYDGRIAWGKPGTQGPARIEGRIGRALRFDGINDFVATDHPGVGGSAPRTIAMWVRIPSYAQAKDALALLGYGEFKPARVWQMSWNSYAADGPVGALRLGVLGDQIVAKTDLRDGEWHHIAATYDGKTARLYVDGELEAAKPMRIDTATGDGAARAIIGRNIAKHAGGFFRGVIDEVVICDEKLSADHIKRLVSENEK